MAGIGGSFAPMQQGMQGGAAAPGGKGGAMQQPMRGGSQGVSGLPTSPYYGSGSQLNGPTVSSNGYTRPDDVQRSGNMRAALGGAAGGTLSQLNPQRGDGRMPRMAVGSDPYNMQQNGAYGTASQGLTDAMNMTAGVGAHGPARLTRTGGAQRADLTRTGGAALASNRDLRSTGLNRYMNPYEDAVIDQSTQDLDRARQIAMNDVGASASAAGAFGGDRHGIVEAETNRNFADSAARMAGGLRQQGFMRAQDMANQDIDRDFNRSMFNTSAKNANRQFNAANANANSQFNANAVNANRQFNAGNANQMATFNSGNMGNQQLAAAGLLGNLANQSFNTGRTISQDQAQQGALQQGLMQQIMNGANQQYNSWANQPQSALQLPLQALGMTPYGQTSTSTSTSNPGFFDYLKAGLTAVGSI